jgi:hypothetical protein
VQFREAPPDPLEAMEEVRAEAAAEGVVPAAEDAAANDEKTWKAPSQPSQGGINDA